VGNVAILFGIVAADPVHVRLRQQRVHPVYTRRGYADFYVRPVSFGGKIPIENKDLAHAETRRAQRKADLSGRAFFGPK
jgi:hypothetical protein